MAILLNLVKSKKKSDMAPKWVTLPSLAVYIMGNLPSTNSTTVDADSVPYLPNHYEGH